MPSIGSVDAANQQMIALINQMNQVVLNAIAQQTDFSLKLAKLSAIGAIDSQSVPGNPSVLNTVA